MILICNTVMTVTRWCSGRAVALQSRGSEFKPQPRDIHFQLIFHNMPASNIIFSFLQLYQYQNILNVLHDSGLEFRGLPFANQ